MGEMYAVLTIPHLLLLRPQHSIPRLFLHAPVSQFPTLPACIVCDDEPTKGMKKKGNICTDINLKNKCNKNASWIKKGYCQLSCYNEGLGYDGDVCCTDR